jgi:hypothetical protein
MISRKLLFLVVIGIGLVVGVSYINAQLPNFYIQELEIIEDPNRPGYYTYIFNFCDNALTVEDPRFMVVSDLEKKTMQLTGIFHSDKCYGAVEKIRANDPDSIRAELISYEDSNQVDKFEEKIAKMTAKVDRLRQELKITMETIYPHHQDHIDATKLKSDELWKARKQLQHLNAQYYEMMSIFHPEQENKGVAFYLKNFGYEFDFEEEDSWIVDYADLPVDFAPSIYDLEYGIRELPENIGGKGMYIQGHNRSDDLFMFLSKEITDLRPNTRYNVLVDVTFATNIPEGMVGIGGSPGESVYVKVGAINHRPNIVVDDQGYLRVDLEKANRFRSGNEMIVVGNIASELVSGGGKFALKTLSNTEPIEVRSNENGSVWVLIGTDSGFEGLTQLYYDKVTVDFTDIS